MQFADYPPRHFRGWKHAFVGKALTFDESPAGRENVSKQSSPWLFHPESRLGLIGCSCVEKDSEAVSAFAEEGCRLD